MSRDTVGGDLNIFQKLMLQWEGLHPYNGIQLLRLGGGRPEMADLSGAWIRASAAVGMGGAFRTDHTWWLDRRSAVVEPVSIEGADEVAAVEGLGVWLNRRFAEGEVPVIPLVVRVPGAWMMGLAYRHYVADSVTVRRWIHAWWRELNGQPLAWSERQAIRAVGYHRAFAGSGGFSMVKGLLDTGRVMGDMARAQRLTGPYECSAQHVLHLGQVAGGRDLLRSAREVGAKVTDVLLAVVGLAAMRHGPMKRSSNRDHLALGSIIDLRPLARRDLGDGLYLGYTNCLLGPSFTGSVAAAVRCIARQSYVQRQTGQAGGSMFRMAAALAGGRVFRGKRLYEFYRKRMPLAAGLSNVNLTGSWVERECPTGTGYLRVSPVGPTMPIVLASTTCEGAMGVTLTYRHPLMSHEGAAAIGRDVRESLEAFCRTGGPRLAEQSLTETAGQSTLSA
jgi:hypothetical protein